MNSELRIRTPEGIVFAYTLAGPVTRCLAYAVDLLIIGAIQRIVSMLLIFAGILAPDVAMGLLIVSFFAVSATASSAVDAV